MLKRYILNKTIAESNSTAQCLMKFRHETSLWKHLMIFHTKFEVPYEALQKKKF